MLRPLPPPVKKMMKKKPRNKKMPVRKIDNRVETAEIELAPIAPMSNPKTETQERPDHLATATVSAASSATALSAAAAVAPRPKAHPMAPAARSATREKAVGLLVCCDAGCGHRRVGYTFMIDGLDCTSSLAPSNALAFLDSLFVCIFVNRSIVSEITSEAFRYSIVLALVYLGRVSSRRGGRPIFARTSVTAACVKISKTILSFCLKEGALEVLVMSKQSLKLCRLYCQKRLRSLKILLKWLPLASPAVVPLRPVINMGKRVTIAMIIAMGILLSVTMGPALPKAFMSPKCVLSAELNIFAMPSMHVELTSSRSNRS